MMELIWLPAERLHPHPDNPRKDLGDLSELADSIRENGIFQNLTVVPEDPADESTDYTVIIGHRRLAAAKIAGLLTLPCIVTEMTEKEQLQTMLLENMQRSDLTIYEQAKGFQMMLDLGCSVEEISETSGFSKTTVRRRLEIAKLDEKTLQKVSARQLAIGDFDELAQVEDMGKRNELLKSMGTANFKNELKCAMEEQRLKKRMEEWLTQIRTFAVENKTANGMSHRFIRSYNKWQLDAEVKIPEDADSTKYIYRLTNNSIELYAEKDAAKEDAARAVREEKNRKERMEEEEREDVTRRHFELRRDFVKGLSRDLCKLMIAKTTGFVADVMWELCGRGYYRAEMDTEILAFLLGIKIDEEEAETADTLTEFPGVRSAAEAFPEKTLLALAFSCFDGPRNGYCEKYWSVDRYRYRYRKNSRLDAVYDLLCEFGYELSDEEKTARSGRHPLFPLDAGKE